MKGQTKGQVKGLIMQSQARAHVNLSGTILPTPLPIQLVVTPPQVAQ